MKHFTVIEGMVVASIVLILVSLAVANFREERANEPVISGDDSSINNYGQGVTGLRYSHEVAEWVNQHPDRRIVNIVRVKGWYSLVIIWERQEGSCKP